MTLNEWIKKYSAFDQILTRSQVAVSLKISPNNLKYKINSGGFEMADQKRPKLVRVGEQ